MKGRIMHRRVAAICLALLCSSPLADEAVLAWQDYKGIIYVTGGIGEDELAEINAARSGFNVRVLLAEKAGTYVAGVRVVVSESNGTKVLEVESAGPYLLAKLPEGNYRISVTYGDQMQQKDFVVQPGRAREFVFRW
jgi:hypothetical protein